MVEVTTEIEILHAETKKVLITVKKIARAATYTGISDHVIFTRLNQKMVLKSQDVYSDKLGHRVLFRRKGHTGPRKLRKLTPEEQAQLQKQRNNESTREVKDLRTDGRQGDLREQA